MMHDRANDHELGWADHGGEAAPAAGKRTLTAGLQRTPGEPGAAPTQPFGPVDAPEEGPERPSVSYVDSIVGNGHAPATPKAGTDYRRHMPNVTGGIDEGATDAAKTVTREQLPGGHLPVRRTFEGSDRTYKTWDGVFGLIPGLQIDTAYAQQRHDYFVTAQKQDARMTDAVAANASLDLMVKYYAHDLEEMPEAERHYNTLVPLANLAVRSGVRMVAINGATDMGAKFLGDQLSGKEKAALKEAVGGETIHASLAVSTAGDRLHAARHQMIASSLTLSNTVRDQTIRALEKERDDAKGDKAKIEKTIAGVTKVVGYLAQAGTYIGGGADFVHARMPGLTPAETGVDVREDTFGTAGKVGKGVGTGAGAVNAAVGFGLNLYFHDKVAELDRTIERVNKEIAVYKLINEAAAIRAAHESFRSAVLNYKTEVDLYMAALTDRRAVMAKIGAAADRHMHNGGNQEHLSKGMLKMNATLETRANLDLAITAGDHAEKRITEIARAVIKHRSTRWGRASDMWGANSLPHQEGDAADLKTITEMQRTTEGWLKAARFVKTQLDKQADADLDPLRAASGWSDAY